MLRREINGNVDQPTSRVNIRQFAFWSVGKLKARQTKGNVDDGFVITIWAMVWWILMAQLYHN